LKKSIELVEKEVFGFKFPNPSGLRGRAPPGEKKKKKKKKKGFLQP